MPELIITEKPNASKRIAEALAENKPTKYSYQGVPYYKLKRGSQEIVVGCAVGHLFGLAEKVRSKGFEYPVFDIEWLPNYAISKEAAHTKKYLNALKKLAKEADKFTVATDYDIEGEVIGLNVVRFVCNRNDARRMKFSTLTKPDLIKAYINAAEHLDWGQAEAGETRHYLDYFYGINLSRALTSAIKTAGLFKILSTGRVQGPAMKIIVDREREIQAFKPVPYWQIELLAKTKKGELVAWHITGKFWEKNKAETVFNKIKGEKSGKIIAVERTEFTQHAPTPFDLTTLQTEAYRCFGIRPNITLKIAQDLYTNGLISYPRTSSQQLPPTIGFAKIIQALSKQKAYKPLASKVLALPRLAPNNGAKTDPAHPAIYPTGIVPKGLEPGHEKIYDLIVKRFLATFGPGAVRETLTITLEVKSEKFVAQGKRTIEQGWYEFYAPYVPFKEIELPSVKEGEDFKVKKVQLHEDQTQPPKRYTPASLIKELEKRGLGTKATRAEIVETLYQRNYIKGESITATTLGMHIVEVLEKYCPKIIDEELTRHFEVDMESVRAGEKKRDAVLEEAKEVLTEILKEFKAREKEIGAGLRETFTETKTKLETVGNCPICKAGMLVIRRGRFGRFIACNRYPECKTTFKLPATGFVEVSKNTCKHCGYPMITMIRKGKKPQEVCINLECPGKAVPKVKERACPKCRIGKLVVRKSVYGAFLACNRYPECKHTEKLETKARA